MHNLINEIWQMNEIIFQEEKKEKERKGWRTSARQLQTWLTVAPYFNRQEKRHESGAPNIRLHQQSHVLSLISSSWNCSSALKGPYTLWTRCKYKNNVQITVQVRVRPPGPFLREYVVAAPMTTRPPRQWEQPQPWKQCSDGKESHKNKKT